jgi:hypothetical protein
MPALLELIKKSSHLSNQEVPYKQILNSFNDIFCLTADGKTLAQPQQLIGSARSHEIIINTGLPISKIFVCTGKFKELETGLNALFQTGKSTSDHKLLRFIKHYILALRRKFSGSSHSEKQKQWLMQVYQDFCTQNENNWLHCTFSNVVNRYFSLKNLKNASIPLRNHSISPKIDIPLDCIEHSR